METAATMILSVFIRRVCPESAGFYFDLILGFFYFFFKACAVRVRETSSSDAHVFAHLCGSFTNSVFGHFGAAE